MTIKEKLGIEDGQKVYCYKQGAFWVAYEQSAYIISLDRHYKPTKKWIKNIGIEVVTIGFPQKGLEKWLETVNPVCIEEQENYRVYIVNNDKSSINGFLLWKESVALQEQAITAHSIEHKIKQFPLANSTPIEAFLFLEKIQKELIITI